MNALLLCASVNYLVNADSNSYSGEHFSHIHCLKKGLYWTKFHLLSSRFFMIGFSVGTERLKLDDSSTCVPICASACTEIFILSHSTSDLDFLCSYFILLLRNSS
jgi:hypothetical protein